MTDEQPQDAEIYDEVTRDQYKSILGSKGGQDDFIVDDDGQGNGYLDDESEEEEQAREESSEDEDAFDGEDEELRKGELNFRAILPT
jgi:DNA polymerase alpha subunit A